MNFKRRKSRRQVRCTICTTYRWMGNKGERFKGRKREHAKRHRDLQNDIQDAWPSG